MDTVKEMSAPPDESQTADPTESSEPREDTQLATDPRVNDEYIRTISEGEGDDLTLVGVVHDHPASVYRARVLITMYAPEVVALEVPPVATPLYQAYAGDSQTPPSFGGEMSAAVQAARNCDAEVVGIDAPTPKFLAQLTRNCWRERASSKTLRRVLSGVTSVTRHAILCRAAAAVADRTSFRVEVDDPVVHDCGREDSPDVQARDERKQASRSQSLLQALEPPEAVLLRDETREDCMAERLQSLRCQGKTVAILGLDHLDGIAERIRE